MINLVTRFNISLDDLHFYLAVLEEHLNGEVLGGYCLTVGGVHQIRYHLECL